MATDQLPSHPWVTWRAHAWWAALVLVPFLVPHAVMTLGTESEKAGSTLVVYGPFIASIWIAGHLTLHHLRRPRPHDVANPAWLPQESRLGK